MHRIFRCTEKDLRKKKLRRYAKWGLAQWIITTRYLQSPQHTQHDGTQKIVLYTIYLRDQGSGIYPLLSKILEGGSKLKKGMPKDLLCGVASWRALQQNLLWLVGGATLGLDGSCHQWGAVQMTMAVLSGTRGMGWHSLGWLLTELDGGTCGSAGPCGMAGWPTVGKRWHMRLTLNIHACMWLQWPKWTINGPSRGKVLRRNYTVQAVCFCSQHWQKGLKDCKKESKMRVSRAQKRSRFSRNSPHIFVHLSGRKELQAKENPLKLRRLVQF